VVRRFGSSRETVRYATAMPSLEFAVDSGRAPRDLPMAAAEEREESKQVEQKWDHRAGILSGSESI
jgi:hypothetical protein